MSEADSSPAESDASRATASLLVGVDAHLDALLKLITRAHLQLRVLSQELDHRLWNDPGVVELLRGFALHSPRAELRILINRPRVAVQRCPRLVELARRLSSRIKVRELAEDRRHLAEEFAIADEYAVLHKKRHDELETWWYPHAPLEARQQRRRFEAWWEEAVPARELAQLGI